jgi:hypothetical protein
MYRGQGTGIVVFVFLASYVEIWQFKDATLLRIYNYMKTKCAVSTKYRDI